VDEAHSAVINHQALAQGRVRWLAFGEIRVSANALTPFHSPACGRMGVELVEDAALFHPAKTCRITGTANAN